MGEKLTEQTETNPEVTEPKGQGSFNPLFWVLVVLGLYVLGSGPAIKLYSSAPQTRPVIDVIYAPLEALCDACPPVQKAMVWYAVTVWGVKFK
jgi:hypothetical protein